MLQVAGRLDLLVYRLCVSANDGQHNTSVDFNVTVIQPGLDVNLVEFSQPLYVFDVVEDASLGVTVGRLEAFVAVVGHPPSSSSSGLSYVISSRWASSVFQLNATYGILTLASSLDYETVSHCHSTNSCLCL